MGAHRFYRYWLSAAVLVMIIASAGGLYTSKASGSAASVDMTRIQQDLPNKVFLPCIFKNVCFPAFFDDFSPQSSGWDSYEDNGPPISVRISNGEYIMDISGPQNVNDDPIFATGFSPLGFESDYKVLVSVWISQAPTDYYQQYGLIFDSDLSDNIFYSFEIVSNGAWYLWKYEFIDQLISPWSQIRYGTSDKINQGAALNRIGIERSGSFVNLYINGYYINPNNEPIPVADGEFEGYIGVIAENSSPGVSRSYYFDNFGLFPVTCDWASIFNGSFTPTPIAQVQAMPALTPLSGQIAPKPR